MPSVPYVHQVPLKACGNLVSPLACPAGLSVEVVPSLRRALPSLRRALPPWHSQPSSRPPPVPGTQQAPGAQGLPTCGYCELLLSPVPVSDCGYLSPAEYPQDPVPTLWNEPPELPSGAGPFDAAATTAARASDATAFPPYTSKLEPEDTTHLHRLDAGDGRWPQDELPAGRSTAAWAVRIADLRFCGPVGGSLSPPQPYCCRRKGTCVTCPSKLPCHRASTLECFASLGAVAKAFLPAPSLTYHSRYLQKVS